MLCNPDFAKITIFTCFLIFLLAIDLFFLISTVITQIFHPTAELAFLTDMHTTEANAEIETQPIKEEV